MSLRVEAMVSIVAAAAVTLSAAFTDWVIAVACLLAESLRFPAISLNVLVLESSFVTVSMSWFVVSDCFVPVALRKSFSFDSRSLWFSSSMKSGSARLQNSSAVASAMRFESLSSICSASSQPTALITAAA